MRKRIFIYLGVVVLLAGGALIIFHKSLSASDPHYEFATVTRGDIQNTVSSTGTLSPVTTVDVGTQVSGIIDSVYVDFNYKVKEGQILAVLDTTLLRSTVLDAEASLERVDAQLMQAQVEFTRSKRLFDSSMISESEYLPYEVNLKTQKAALKSAQVALDRAQRNLQYAVIKSPINGIVVNKNVEAGQTVASSLSTPTLFSIAQDLSQMEILTEVDESDIGQIKEGQDVQFEVAAYMNKEFKGTVKQVRLQPKTVSNVVTYTAVVVADNKDGSLLPGMTATVSFITDKHSDVLLVPSKALRFQPPDEILAAFRASRKQARGQFDSAKGMGRMGSDSARAMWRGQGDSSHAGGRGDFAMGQGGIGGAPGGGGGGGRSMQRNMSMVWYVDSLGHLNGAPVRTGMSDKSNTEIVFGRGVADGMQVIVGIIDDSNKNGAASKTAQQPPTFGRMRGF